MWKRILLSLAICCLTFLLMEGALRIVELHSKKIRFYTSNSYQTQTVDVTSNLQLLLNTLPGALWPGADVNGFTINDKGFLTPDLPYDNPQKTKRLVLLGDSQGIGIVPYPQTFIQILEQKIRTEDTIPFDAINLSIAGIGTRVEREILNLEGKQYNPDVIILSFNIGNDFSDDQLAITRYLAQSQRKNVAPFFLYQSRVFSLFRNSLLILQSRYAGPTIHSDANAISGTYTGDAFYDENQNITDKQTYLKQASQQLNIYLADESAYQNINDISDAIHSMKKIAESIHASLFVIIIPTPVQLDTTLLSQELEYFDKPQSSLDLTLPQKKIKHILTSENIGYLDLLEAWSSDSAAMTYYRKNDDHLNLAGNKAVSDLLFPIVHQMLGDR